MTRKTYTAIDFVSNGLEDQRSGANGDQEKDPLMNASATPVAKKKVDWQLAAEKISVGLSVICLIPALAWRMSALGNNLLVRVSRETLLFSNDSSVEDGMRLLHSNWNNH